jgi:diacylglycerol kinase family enzyme
LSLLSAARVQYNAQGETVQGDSQALRPVRAQECSVRAMAAGELCVIFNPKAGKRRAAQRFARLRQAWGTHVTFWETARAGHAEELARLAAGQGFTVVAAAGGDGTVHEVANGLLQAGRPEVIFAVVPIGSANDYAHSLMHGNGQAALRPRAVDVGVVRDEHGRQRHFLCCLGLGFNGTVTLEAGRIRRLQGVALYGLATLRALWYHYACPNMTLTIDDESPQTVPTLMLSVLLGRREGGFVMAPRAELDDGLFDFIHAGPLSRWEVLRLLPRLALWGPPAEYPKVRQGRCRKITLRSEAPLVVHIDGEFFCRPEDAIQSLDIHIVPRALRVQAGLPEPQELAAEKSRASSQALQVGNKIL